MGACKVVIWHTVLTIALLGTTLPAPAPDELAEQLRTAIVAQAFKDVLDLTPPRPNPWGAPEKYDRLGAQPRDKVEPRPLHQTPNLDVAVIELDRLGRPRTMADVLLSPRYPQGAVVRSSDAVRYRWWNDVEWNTQGGQGSRDVLPGREQAPLDFTSPYPASVLKLMVGFGVLRLADQGRVDLDEDYDYRPEPVSQSCGGPTVKPIRVLFDEMITRSQNESTCALVKMIDELDAWDEINDTFAELGMPTLMMTGFNPGNGGRWSGANMSGPDTAKLLLLLAGGPGVLWVTPDHRPVTRGELSRSSREFFLRTLADQGHNEMLSTTNWCDRAYPVQGIPQRTPPRWIRPDGTVQVGNAVYDRDVRPCDARAEVTFAHKTGWVSTAGSDAGVVSAPEGRHYIVVVFGNLGTGYVDRDRPADPPGIYKVLYTQKYAQLGKAIDEIMRARVAYH
ncbi:hypothetical protein D5S17_06030 [Pseudonocardiaceae bacterium YIM PH 21723]|nr:hypothetical protein D5S17_06030 [Pseudonocardiaceae bacterium YIM PH 21723]